MATEKGNTEKKTVAKKTTAAKKTTGTGKGKVGAPLGNTNNPNGRPKGSKNKIQYDIRKSIYEKVSDVDYINDLFTDIEKVKQPYARAKLKIELVKLFVPKPLNDDEQQDNDIRSAMYAKLAGEVLKEE